MSISVQDAIDVVAAALQDVDTVDWATDFSANVTVDAIPEKNWETKKLRETTLLHLYGGGSDFEMLNRAGLLVELPTFFLTTIHYVGFDETGSLRTDQVAIAEAVQKKAIQVARTALINSNRFAPLRIEKPARWDTDHMGRGDYVSLTVFSLRDSLGI